MMMEREGNEALVSGEDDGISRNPEFMGVRWEEGAFQGE